MAKTTGPNRSWPRRQELLVFGKDDKAVWRWARAARSRVLLGESYDGGVSGQLGESGGVPGQLGVVPVRLGDRGVILGLLGERGGRRRSRQSDHGGVPGQLGGVPGLLDEPCVRIDRSVMAVLPC